jgi:hypothetical protein
VGEVDPPEPPPHPQIKKIRKLEAKKHLSACILFKAHTEQNLPRENSPVSYHTQQRPDAKKLKPSGFLP